jgi:cyclopropane-fatty-acyl-phospholipid synthase
MFEAVGEKYWKTYFGTIKRSLNKNGKAIVQTIYIRDEDFESYRKIVIT